MGDLEWWNDYYVDELDRAWLPKTVAGASSVSNTTMIITDPASPGGSETTSRSTTCVPGWLRWTPLLKKGEGIDGYKDCIAHMLVHGNGRTRVRSAYRHSMAYAYFSARNHVRPARRVGGLLGRPERRSDRYNKYWLTGTDARYFKVKNKGPLTAYSTNVLATRPLPQGAYKFNRHSQLGVYQPCTLCQRIMCNWQSPSPPPLMLSTRRSSTP